MAKSLRASSEGLAIVDRARQRRGWTKTSTARWWQDANTSRATLRRFWQGDRIQPDIFIALCQAVGISDWEAIAKPLELSSPPPISSLLTPHLDLDEAPDVEAFYGRQPELQQLEQWIVSDRCEIVAIAGLGGIGKTALALALTERVQTEFSFVIWRSLRSVPSFHHLLDSILQPFDPAIPQTFQQRVHQLIQHLQQHRCLLILDGLETVLKQENTYTLFLLTYLLPATHQSCILLTSRERLSELEEVVRNRASVRSMTLQGLLQTEAVELLKAGGIMGNQMELLALSRLYSGNPLALKVVTPVIQFILGGNIAAFLNQKTLVLGDRLRAVLTQQLDQLSDLERELVYWLAIWQEPISFCRLQTHLLHSPDLSLVLEALANLERRSLLEKWFSTNEPAFTLQPLIMKLVTEALIAQATQEVEQVLQSHDVREFKLLRTHWLLRPGTDDIKGDRILSQLREELWRIYGAALPSVLQQILPLLKEQSPLVIGYVGCNIMALLTQLNLNPIH
ncbi:NB-ARC domain-containing protein [Trichocoleus sp. FACHB-262]|uniref:NB-ARC domain-containing protein n=1 Tax=Trichocoleus sp. FACHB-262 TaxID=2692869 RepID=UPI001685449C|nr:NB-ARC domain-containing protein [Trichocoleus sp. FACHB-262]MBD2119391.1 NACHT domain-containing protein [Trichocoleus sp. FACHB-262]